MQISSSRETESLKRGLATDQMRILVIEDDPTVGQYVKRGLEEHRWAVDLVTDGEDGERRATSEAYDLIILDMRLPGKSGRPLPLSIGRSRLRKPIRESRVPMCR